ncbi:MAG: STAS domain-containing protein [Actinomycetota bacterium]
MTASGHRSVVLVLSGRIARAEIPALCARARRLLEGGDANELVCDVGGLRDVDAVAVDALAHLRLLVRRVGCAFVLRRPSAELEDLADLMGLAEILPRSGLETHRQVEERE